MAEKDIDDRPNALLTKKDREWLTADEPLYTGKSAAQQRYRRRTSIRDRVVASLEDFVLLFRELEDSELEKIRDQMDTRPVEAESGDITMRLTSSGPPAITRALAFLCLLHEDIDHFELSLRTALSVVSRQRSGTYYQKVSVDIDLEEWTDDDIQALKNKIRNGELHSLTRAEQDFLIEGVDIDVLSAVIEEFDAREEQDTAGDE
jgi:hypothetical protein